MPSLRLAIPACLMLAGCHSPAPAPAKPKEAGYIARVKALTEAQRSAVLFRAIRDAEQPCQAVVTAKDTVAASGDPAWLATCDDGGQWVVILADDGTATVLSAKDVAAKQ